MRELHREVHRLAIQPHVKVANERAEIEQNLERVCNMIDFGVGYFWELPVRLIVLPSISCRASRRRQGRARHR